MPLHSKLLAWQPGQTILHKVYSCSSKSLIYSKLSKSNKIRNVKILQRNGTLVEYVDLQHKCYSDGLNCDKASSQNSLFPLQCSHLLFEETPLFFTLEGGKQNIKLLEFKDYNFNDYCCKNGTHIVKFHGHDCQQNFIGNCSFSEAFKIGKCDEFYSINHSSVCLIAMISIE